MKHILTFILLFTTLTVAAQNYSPCYTNNIAKGDAAYKQGKYSEAKTYYTTAKQCAGGNSAEAQQKINGCDAKIKAQKEAEAKRRKEARWKAEQEEAEAMQKAKQEEVERKRNATERVKEAKRLAEQFAQAKSPKGYVDISVNNVTFKMVYVDGGTFTMGEKWDFSDAKPEHLVTLSDYLIGETEVTQALWRAVMGNNPSYYKGDNLPVESVSWKDCQSFCNKLNEKMSGLLPSGYRFSLPTEAQWEYAAQGGNKGKGFQFVGGDSIDNFSWCFINSGDKYLSNGWNIDTITANHCRSHPVKRKHANELGLYDMGGNVEEWCLDWMGEYDSSSQTDPQGPPSGSKRVMRGGCWCYAPYSCKAYPRNSNIPDYRSYYCGFRLVLISEEENTKRRVEEENKKQKAEEETKLRGYENVTVNGVTFKMIYVEGGTFTMGCASDQGNSCYNNEKPAHPVTLDDFYIGETEVTQALWKAVMGSNPSFFKGDELPVESVNWDDCQQFIQKLNELTKKTFRLPTEAEWEYAARGGNRSRDCVYSGSNEINGVAWYWQNSGDKYLKGTDDNWKLKIIDNNHLRTHPVKTKAVNELGVYDMSGNVYEWCLDWYGNYSDSSQTNPMGPSSGSNRVLRGGSWVYYAKYCRVLYRESLSPSSRYRTNGFRLVLVRE